MLLWPISFYYSAAGEAVVESVDPQHAERAKVQYLVCFTARSPLEKAKAIVLKGVTYYDEANVT